MRQQALGLIETVGYATAVSAADAALKAADVTLVAMEKVIGAGGALGVTIHLSGDVAAVSSAVEAGRAEAERVGKVISAHVIPRAHNEVNEKILTRFLINEIQGEPSGSVKVTIDKSTAKAKKTGGVPRKNGLDPLRGTAEVQPNQPDQEETTN
jgi:ethanolamine utilization protein EutM